MKSMQTPLLSALRSRRYGAGLVASVCLVCAAAGAAWAQDDAFMGDYQGERTLQDGTKAPLVAQVIALGDGNYRANLINEFDKRIPLVAVLDGRLADGKVTFSGTNEGTEWAGSIDNEVFSGSFKGDKPGAFAMKHTVRLSPTLGEKPPAGAIVLFDGTNTDAWEHPDTRQWLVDLKKAIGGDQCVAYIRTYVWSQKAQAARLDAGSDDGVKVWLNDELIHMKNVSRGVEPGADKITVRLKEGMNALLMKISQGSGGWGACAQFRAPDGGKLAGLRAAAQPDAEKAVSLDEGDGFILDWGVSDRYDRAGVPGQELLDVAFAPETGNDRGLNWRELSLRGPVDKTCRWKLVEGGAMEVYRGSLASKGQFGGHKLHIEFRTPFMPKARGQARGNSGVYVQGRYEIQVLDSYGLEGLDNECGGLYKIAQPLVNMCAPPLQWQTYDITLHAAQVDASGNVVKNARMTVVHNGVAIHDDLELKQTTPGGVSYDLSKPGPVFLQDHGNPVQYRNIWVQPL